MEKGSLIYETLSGAINVSDIQYITSPKNSQGQYGYSIKLSNEFYFVTVSIDSELTTEGLELKKEHLNDDYKNLVAKWREFIDSESVQDNLNHNNHNNHNNCSGCSNTKSVLLTEKLDEF